MLSYDLVTDKEENMTAPQHCPGFEQLRNLEYFICKCPECGENIEVFSDELNRKHICPACGKQIDCMKCPHYLNGHGKSAGPR
jgi:hypothetical protein